MDRSLGFGSIAQYSIFALFRLGFPTAPNLTWFLTSHYTNNSPDRSTKSTTSHFNVLCLLVNIRFQVLFHSPPGVLFNFPSRYCFTIGHQGVFSLTRWSSLLPTRFLVSCRTLDTTVLLHVSLTRLSLSLVCFPKTFLLRFKVTSVVLTLSVFLLLVWALLLSLATTYRIDCFLSFPVGTQMFQFPTSRLHILFDSYMDTSVLPLAGFPIRISRASYGYLLLTMAFRSLSRPSSPLDAQAFTLCSYQLNLFLPKFLFSDFITIL